MKSAYDIILHPLSTEKSIRLMESQNKIIFAIAKKATKNDVKTSIEGMFKVKVTKVNTLILPDGKKRAYVTFSKQTPAIDVATQLGLM